MDDVAPVAGLPLPGPDVIRDAARRLVIERPGIGVDALIEALGQQFGFGPEDESHVAAVDRVLDPLMLGDTWAMLSPDRLLDTVHSSQGLVLTHRITSFERLADRLSVAADLSGFATLGPSLRTADGVALTRSHGPWGHRWWDGPHGWLDRFEDDALVAVRIVDGTAHIDVLDTEPPDDPALVAALRAIYDREVAEPDLPVTAGDLLWGLLMEDAGRFHTPGRPLIDTCMAAGLEVIGGLTAHDPELWDNHRQLNRIHEIFAAFDNRDDRDRAIAALDVLEGRVIDEVAVAEALDGLRDPGFLSAVSTLAFGGDDSDADEIRPVVEDLLTRSWPPRTEALLRWFAAIAAERCFEPLAALAHLEAAVGVDDGFAVAIDRLAWYRSDQGDAAGAARLWRRLAAGQVDVDLAVVEHYAAAPRSTSRIGRNERCWCGSGRKFKVCHLGQREAAPLPDRALWLWRKAEAFIERRGGDLGEYANELAEIRCGSDDPDDVADAIADPLILDVVLTELEGLDSFVLERGPLLPDDEALLARSWTLVERTIYEITAIDPRRSMTLRDLRTGDMVDIDHQSVTNWAKPGLLVCGRALPDGRGHRFLGSAFPVTPGTEQLLLDILDEADGYALVEFVAAAFRPPTMSTREGEPMVECKAVVCVGDPHEARALLDRTYESDDDGRWVELHDLGDGSPELAERILRATLTLEGDELRIETMSEPRLERVLAAIADGLPSAEVVSDTRSPIDAEAVRKLATSAPPPASLFTAADQPALQAAMTEIRDRFERRWCDEPVPALGGLTPRAAVADVTRRHEVVRLLASFPDPDDGGGLMPTSGGAMLRPARLRQLLGLDE